MVTIKQIVTSSDWDLKVDAAGFSDAAPGLFWRCLLIDHETISAPDLDIDKGELISSILNIEASLHRTSNASAPSRCWLFYCPGDEP